MSPRRMRPMQLLRVLLAGCVLGASGGTVWANPDAIVVEADRPAARESGRQSTPATSTASTGWFRSSTNAWPAVDESLARAPARARPPGPALPLHLAHARLLL